jgi:hypothetical protein
MPLNGYKMPLKQREKIRLGNLGKHSPKGDNVQPATGRVRAQRMYPCPKGYERHHIDGNPLNNNPNNIQIVTHKEHVTIDGRLVKLREKGKHPSQEAIERNRLAHLGKPCSQVTRDKIRQSLLGRLLC